MFKILLAICKQTKNQMITHEEEWQEQYSTKNTSYFAGKYKRERKNLATLYKLLKVNSKHESQKYWN